MKKSLFILIAFVSFATGWNTILAELTDDETSTVPTGTQVNVDTEASSTAPSLKGSVLPRDLNSQTDSLDYPLYRPHGSKYYPPKTAQTATLLSATLPGLGQAYSRPPCEGLSLSGCRNWIDSGGRIPCGTVP